MNEIFCGGVAGTRTQNQLLKRQLLYQLSYHSSSQTGRHFAFLLRKKCYGLHAAPLNKNSCPTYGLRT